MKKRFLIVLFSLMFIAGLALLCYPTVSDLWNSYTQSKAVVTYNHEINSMDKDVVKKYLDEANEYNFKLRDNISRWKMTEEETEEYKKQLDFALEGIMGYIEIPKIKVSAPIYHGTSEGVLKKGLGHLQGSSLPVGGKGTHSAVSGHTGLPSAKLLTDIHKLEIGDKFYINILENTLVYKVDQILVVEPEEMTALKIEEDQDYCTLITCTPYGINSHRLLVRGHRELEDTSIDNSNNIQPKEDYTIFVVIAVALGTIILLSIITIIIKVKRKQLKK